MTKPQNVLVMRDVACAGYVAGGNCRFFAENDDGQYTVEACNANLMSRLSFADDVTDKYASMMAFPAHEGQFKGGQLDTCMSVTTRVLPWEVQNNTTHDSFPGGHKMFLAYQRKLNLNQVHYGEDMKAAENQARSPPRPLHRQSPAHRLALCVRRISFPKDLLTTARAFLVPTASTTRSPRPSCRSRLARATCAPAATARARPRVPVAHHRSCLACAQFGPDAIPGDARWRRGESVSLKTARDSLVSLELAQHAQMVYSQRP